MFKFAHRILASSPAHAAVTDQDINEVAAMLTRNLNIQFEPLKPGKVKCLVSDSAMSAWSKKNLGSVLKEEGFDKSGQGWEKDGLQVMVTDDHVILQESGPK